MGKVVGGRAFTGTKRAAGEEGESDSQVTLSLITGVTRTMAKRVPPRQGLSARARKKGFAVHQENL